MAIIGVIITNPDGNSSPVIVVEPNRDSLIKVNPAASGDGVNSFTVVENVPVVKNETTSYKTEVDVSADNSKTIYIGDSPVQMRATDTHIQWRNVKNSVWANLIALADFMGGAGADGREIELSSNATHLLWRYVGEAEWNNLIAISDFYVQSDWNQENPLSPEYIHNKPTIPIAIDGREIELQTSATHIQWRYVGEETWTNLIALSALEGAPGQDGADGAPGADGITPHIGVDGFWYIGTTNTGVQAEGQDGADGSDGVGIASVTLISTAGLNKTYRITFTNATTFDYVVTDGADGEDGSPGTPGAPGADGDDGREIELQTSATHIQWRYVGDSTWINLIALADLEGEQGLPGAPGEDGREVELQTSLTHIQWRYTGGTWINLIALSALKGDPGEPGADGDDGREIELQTSLTHIQWRYTGGRWTDLIALSALEGEQGLPGADGDDGREIEIAIVEDPFVGGDFIKWRYVGTSSWTTLISVAAITGADGAPGADGDDGREVELRVTTTHIQWRYTYDALWTDLIALSELQGEPGQDGADGASTYYTTHTLALSGIVPENTYFPGFTIDRILVSGSYTENQKIVRIAGRTLSGSVGIAIHRIIHGQSTGAKILPPSSSTYSIGNTGNTYDVDYMLSHNNYIYFFIPLGYVNLGEDLSVTITIEHTLVSSGGIEI